MILVDERFDVDERRRRWPVRSTEEMTHASMLAWASACTRVPLGAALAHEDVAGGDMLAAEPFQA